MTSKYKQNRLCLILSIALTLPTIHFVAAFIPISRHGTSSSSSTSSIRISPRPNWNSLSSSIQNGRRQVRDTQWKHIGPLFVSTSERILASEKKPERKPSNANNINNKNRRSNGRNNKGSYRNTNPWQADFKTSLRTQGRIKKAYGTRFKTRTKKAKEILKALLTTHPTQVNAANVICALTFSAKSLGAGQMRTDQQLRSMLFQTFDILNEMVQKQLLNTRQLCNACWAIAKHYDRDHELLPTPHEAIALSDEGAVGTAVQLSIAKTSEKEESQALLDETLDEIAIQLTDILDAEMDGIKLFPWLKPAQVGEICMASWAFGKLRHRRKPPGWQALPQIGRLSKKKVSNRRNEAQDVITFENWDSIGTGASFGNDGNSEMEASLMYDKDVTNSLFDAIGASLCCPSEMSGDEIATVSFEAEEDEWEEDVHHRTRLEDCSWSELANLGWAFAAQGSCRSDEAQTLLQNLAREASHRLHTGGTSTQGLLTRDLAQLIWALGTLQADNFRLADDLIALVADLSDKYLNLNSRRASFSRAVRPLKNWSCADLVQVTLALAHARIDEQPLLKAIYEENNYRLSEGIEEETANSHQQRKGFFPWEVSVLLWAQARLYLKDEQGEEFEEFAEDASGYILSSVGRGESIQSIGIGSQEQANIVWSLAVLEEHHSPTSIKLIQRIFHEAAKSFEEHQSIQLEHAHQLWQAYFIIREESPDAVKYVPEWFSSYLEKKWNLEKARGKISSARHRSISQCLHFMGVDHYNEHDEDIDVAIVLKKNALWTHETQDESEATDNVSVAVEFDGPNHFTREKRDENGKLESQPRALGHSVLKYRLLKKSGWTVVRIPYFEFDKIPFWASMERQRYLQRKLKTHCNIKFSEKDVSVYQPLVANRKSRFD